MNTVRGLAGLTVLSSLAFSLAGCGGEEPTTAGAAAAPSASATPAASEELLSSVPDGEVAAYAYASSGSCFAMTGVLDAPNKAISSTVSEKIPELGGTLTMTFLAFGTEKPFVKIATKPASVGRRIGVPTGWLSADPAKLTDFSDTPMSYNGEIDPLGASVLLGTATDIERAGDGTFTGTADLSDIAATHPVLDEDEIKQLGGKAKAVPFTATVDAKSGHLAKVAVKIPPAGKVKGGTCTLAYTGFGTTKEIAEPAAAGVKKANATVYEMLNG